MGEVTRRALAAAEVLADESWNPVRGWSVPGDLMMMQMARVVSRPLIPIKEDGFLGIGTDRPKRLTAADGD